MEKSQLIYFSKELEKFDEINFELNNSINECKLQVKYLGVVLDRKVTWRVHRDHKVKKTLIQRLDLWPFITPQNRLNLRHNLTL